LVPAVQHEVALLSYSTKRQLDSNDDRRQASIQEAAEALFRPREPLIEVAAPTDQIRRAPRVLAAVSAPSNQHEPAETPAAVTAPQAVAANIPASHAARIRTWIRYGMTPKQVAAIYRVEISELRRVLRGT
jgi:hypothetical protein